MNTMKSYLKPKNIITVIVFIAICVFTALIAPVSGDKHWYSIIPPLLAVSLALLTNRLLMSLALSVFVGGFLTSVPSSPLSVKSWFDGLTTGAKYIIFSVVNWTNIQILIFVILILAMISVMVRAGGLKGIVLWLSRFAKDSWSSQLITVLMGLAVFIDDYANTMIIGTSIRPITDKNLVSREKLAFLVDATSAPVAGIAVISTWIGYEVGLFSQVGKTLGIAKDGYSMFFDALNFRFYCIMMIVFLFVNILTKKDYGYMKDAENRVKRTGKLLDDDAKPMTSKAFTKLDPHQQAKILARTAIIPIIILFAFLLGGLWIDGGGTFDKLFRPSEWRNIISEADNIFILMVSSGVGLLTSIICGYGFAKIPISVIGKAILSGGRSSLLPIFILVLAWSLKSSCDGLQTGAFLASAIGDVLSPLWFPAMVFIVACLTSFATGTSWGTMAILSPTAIPIAFQLDNQIYGLTTVISLGAVLDGAIFGDHCSPISDTTIMSSISSSCDHLHHVKTQFPYSLTVGILALLLGYIPSAMGVPSFVGILVSPVFMVVIFYLLDREPST